MRNYNNTSGCPNSPSLRSNVFSLWLLLIERPKYCTISIYSVVTHHGRVCQNRNLVNVTGHKGSYWKHIWSWLPVWARISAKSNFFALLISKSAAMAHCGLWTPPYLPESPTLHPINHSAYQISLDVTVAWGEYQNAKSTKHVTVTRSYW